MNIELKIVPRISDNLKLVVHNKCLRFDETEENFGKYCNKYHIILSIYTKDNILVSQIFVADARYDCQKIKLIFVTGTQKEYEKRGYMTSLLYFSQKIYDKVFLVPDDDELIKFYKKRGFTEKCRINEVSFEDEELTHSELFIMI